MRNSATRSQPQRAGKPPQILGNKAMNHKLSLTKAHLKLPGIHPRVLIIAHL
jgi:hypothetical protein